MTPPRIAIGSALIFSRRPSPVVPFGEFGLKHLVTFPEFIDFAPQSLVLEPRIPFPFRMRGGGGHIRLALGH